MKNSRWIICFDFETDSPDPDTCNPVELAAVPINPETLEIKADQSFSTTLKPIDIDKPEYFTPEREKTIQWHAENRQISYDDVIKSWTNSVAPKIAWKNFCIYCDKYKVDKKRGQWYPEPIPAGYNINGFDLKIARRLCQQYKTKWPFSEVTVLDAMDNLFWWFENLDEPEDLKMNTLRPFLGLTAHGQAHEALSDVIDEAKIITRFLKFHRKQARIDKFKGSFS